MTKRSWPPPQATRRPPGGGPTGPSQAEVGVAVAKFNAGRFAEVEAVARSLTERHPQHPFGWKVLGAALKQQGRLDEALPAMRQAVALVRTDAEAHGNLGIVLLNLGRLAEAETVLRQALDLKPNYAAAHSNLGAVLLSQDRPVEAEASYRRTLELAPDYAEAHNNLAIALLDQGRFAEAHAGARRAVALAPDYALAHGTSGAIFGDQARPPEAAVAHKRSWAISPDALRFAIRARLLLPAVEGSRETIARSRRHYEDGIAALAAVVPTRFGATESINLQSFHLAHHGQDDRPILEALGRVLREKASNLTWTAPHIDGWRVPAESGRRFKVGFLSRHFSAHAVGRQFRGFVRHLDRTRFEVIVFHTANSTPDAFRREVDALADKAIVLPAGHDDQQAAIAAEALDVLFYPDVGRVSSSTFLAYARLAPVQAVSVGHPDTTGLETVDYFVSAAPMEPDDADDHYTERLIRLNRLPSVYPPPSAPDPLPGRAALGLPETGTLYGCLQSLFKFHPDFDPILAAIADGDPDGRIVLIEGSDPNGSRLLKARWEKTFPVLLERTLFLPVLPFADFMALMAHIDVGLDPVHSGGGDTFYEAMAFGLPVVTWPGTFMRGRIAAGAYRQMAVADAPVVSRLEDYAPLALALGRDPERRRALRAASLDAARRELFEDTRVVRDLEAFLEAAIAAAGRGEKLSKGWRPPLS